jgi:RimJ/RimL family protein N-acetyltransferase
MVIEPVTLRGGGVRLEAMTAGHIDALARVGLNPEIWRWGIAPLTTWDDMRKYVEQALEDRQRGVSLPFVIIAQPSNELVGSTRYGNVDLANRRLEIGWTWVTPAYQRTAINTEAKLLLLTHAFEQLQVHRVELKTDALNQRSRAAILRIGAVEEGTFRKHIVTASGRVRDSVYYSILDTEWPAVKAELKSKLAMSSPVTP